MIKQLLIVWLWVMAGLSIGYLMWVMAHNAESSAVHKDVVDIQTSNVWNVVSLFTNDITTHMSNTAFMLNYEGPDIMIHRPADSADVVFCLGGNEIVRLCMTNGLVTVAEGYTPDEAASNFWMAVRMAWDQIPVEDKH